MKIILISFFLLHSFFAISADFYVSPSGDDNNPGTKEKPFATIEKAYESVVRAAATDTKSDHFVLLAAGQYNIEKPLAISSSDFEKFIGRLVFKPAGKGEVVISGGYKLTGWQNSGGDLWFAGLPSGIIKPRELFAGLKRAVRARYPDTGYLRVKKAGEDRRTSFFFNEGDFPVPAEEEKVELVLLHDWSVSRIRVKEINYEENRLIAVDSIGARKPAFFNIDHWEPDPRYFLENSKEFLNADYEWYYDEAERKVLLKLPEGLSPNDIDITIPVSEGLIKLRGDENNLLKNIHFEGITFRHSFWEIPEKGYCGIQACHFDPRFNGKGWSVVPAAFFAEWTENCTVSDCTFENIGGSGLWFSTGCRDCSISDSRFSDISGNGVMIGEGRDRETKGDKWWISAPGQVATGNKIENCVVTGCGQQFSGAVGVWCGLTAETVITENEIHGLPYTGISIGWMWSPVPTPCRENIIEGNHIHHIMQVLSDGGGIYMLGLQPGSQIRGNRIHDVSINAGRAESNGMFLDEGTTDVEVVNNLIYNIAKSPLRFHRATTNLVMNNYLFCKEGTAPIRYNNTKEEDIKKVDNKVFTETGPDYEKNLKKAVRRWK
jgi:hypothetical protein